ncbi:MAG: CvpA family protein, partial [Clostridia bacterium]|nr:CvpA family protein [Clostridia bacterium]
MSIALSVVLILIVVLFTVIGAKKGFFKTIAGLISPLASLVLTILFYKPVAAMLKSTLFASMVTDVKLPDFEGAKDVISQVTVMMEYLNSNDLGEVSEA